MIRIISIIFFILFHSSQYQPAVITVNLDVESKKKLVALAKIPENKRTQIESCVPNPCVNDGACVLREATKTYNCKCHGNYTGKDKNIYCYYIISLAVNETCTIKS